jgi:hypothetical protein
MSKLELVRGADGAVAGDFVHNSQNMSADVGFKCVSRLWYDKTISISDGINQIIDDSKKRVDINVKPNEFKVDIGQNGKTVIVVKGVEYTPTEHAWNQICGWFQVPITYFKMATRDNIRKKKVVSADRQDWETVATVFKNGHRKIENDKEFLFRVDVEGNCRAMLTDIYAIINNVWYLEVLAEAFKKIGGDEPRLSHWRGNADTIYGNILIPDSCRAKQDSDYGGMISASNCEIGKRRLKQLPSIFRAICMNGCIWGQVNGDPLNKVHRGEVDLKDLAKRILTNIQLQIPMMGNGIAALLDTKNKVIPLTTSMQGIFAKLGLTYGLTPVQVNEVYKQWVDFESHDKNLFGVINAVTRAGQKFNNETWYDFDVLGGKLIEFSIGKGKNSWETFVRQAQDLTKEELNNAYGIE